MSNVAILKGALTFVPGLYTLLSKGRTGGTDSAYYCYGVWLKHMSFLFQNGMNRMPDCIAELGPGDSIGVGLAALLSGVRKYYALDVVRFANAERNLVIFDQLVELFTSRARRPTKGWPDFDHLLDSNLFPSSILTNSVLDESLAPERVSAIRNAITESNVPGRPGFIEYLVPWESHAQLSRGTMDLIISHSVLEHVTNLETTYRDLAFYLRAGGWMSHQVDFGSHGIDKVWNAHWSYSDLVWKVVVGRRPFLINREPCSRHMELLRKHFDIVDARQHHRQDGIGRARLAGSWRHLSDDDLACSGLFVQVRKPSSL
jgi:hypothetical protein